VPPDPQLSSRSLARLIEQVGKACYNLGYTPGLNPAQWAALRYFQETTTDQCTVTGFANFQGTTKGTASQTVAALVRKGYLKRVADKKDRRVHRLVLTPEGEAMIAQDPLQALADAVEKLEEQDRWALAINMERVLRELIRA
jgi:DNA-binding MarR family transcriptional regulator|tara:strand:+ start:2255 stop:2680 length:426 start_codon:yes stop_codon:yes gene_type:complete